MAAPEAGSSTAAASNAAASPTAGSHPADPPHATSAAAHPWYRSKAPARPTLRTLAVMTVSSVIGLVALVAVGQLLGHTVLIAPLAATMALVIGGGSLPLAQPRNVIGGQLVSTLVAFAVQAGAGSSAWTAAVAGGLALGVMSLLKVSHSPAAATAVIVVLERPEIIRFTALLLLALVIMIGFGVVTARAHRTSYPLYWW